jgi:pyrimidine-nucleoside phosphorylase
MMFTPSVLIQKKRDGLALSEKEIRFLIEGISKGEIPDYQATAFLMATYFKGMTPEETVHLTTAMIESGDRNNFSSISGAKVDKHSTGGIGDKVSLILAPLAASCGLIVPMMAGRGLGHTGGTLDKLESISGFNVKLSQAQFKEILKTVGCAIIGQSETICPADRKLYALRDVTATIECTPLIVGSILSKKVAEGAEALVLDVKVGNGAFMRSKDQAKKLARALITVAKKMGLKCRALITNMDQPLGFAVGNSLEVIECIEMMKTGTGALDLKEVTIQLCAHMLEAGGKVKTIAQGRKLAAQNLANGSAWRKFQEMVEAQGGSLKQIHSTELFPLAHKIVQWKSPKKGYIVKMDTHEIGQMLVDLGGGRKKTSDEVDPSVGFVFHKKLGALVSTHDVLVTAHLPSGVDVGAWEKRFQSTLEIRSQRKTVPKLIAEVLG